MAEYIVRILMNDDRINEGELIRCRDCQHYIHMDEETAYCEMHGMPYLDDDFFCANGSSAKVREEYDRNDS